MAQAKPEVHWTLLPSHISPFPDSLPRVIPSPATEASLRAPFGINPSLYNFALRPEIPVLFASIYMITVLYLNAHNKRNNNKPWRISRTEEFGQFVVAHNVLLALYSFATFVAMGRAITQSLPPWDADAWSVRVADGLCKLHGPRGLGDAATFNTTINIWEVKNTGIKLTPSGVPDPTDVGRLWNEGLAFWGWLFYVSKFYEVLDTFIVLAKGKRSGTLQTYHHAGAMLCMWAGIRYMSPPIWMFVFVNSGIHALMYTYYTASALGVHVPPGLKRALTILQITQFVWGASYAAAHLFVQYDIPITTPFQVVHAVQRASSSAHSAANSATSAVSSFAESPTVTAAVGAYIKKLLLRAAGEQGVAERVALGWQQQLQQQFSLGNPFGSSNPSKLEDKVQNFIEKRFETRYRKDWTRVNCIDTSGEAFAIYLNLLYLSPLTWLFVRFFVRAYTQRGRYEKAPYAKEVLRDARLAARETHGTFEEGGEKIEDEIEKRGSEAEEELRKDVQKVVDELRSGKGLKAGVNEAQEKVKSMVESVANKIEEVTSSSTTQQESSSTEQQESSSTEQQESSSTAQQESSTSSYTHEESSTSHQESSTSSSFKQQEQLERQSSSTWIRGGGGLFRRGFSSEEDVTLKGEDTELSKDQQDANLEASQPTRPDPEDDTDAMGKSGAIVQPEDSADDETHG